MTRTVDLLKRIHRLGVLGLLGGLLVLPGDAVAQEWDSPRVLRMVEDARVRRALPYADSALRSYSASAQGYVYFYLDREEIEELTLVKVDQVALEVYWAYPGSTKQRIVGLRNESVLPNRMRYHLDHLTVVQNEFGDRIQLGDGDEVQSVVHPIAPGSEAVYNFRLADSLSLRLGGLPEPLRVYEIEVRPRDRAAPGFVGSVFIDAAASDIVRMDFTFTRSSYVDRRLDYIRISLENGLWEGRFWLPYEQRVELRRQLPELDFPAGAVIRGEMRVRDYAFNVPLPPSLFRGPAVTSVPRAQREAFAFEQDLFAELAEEGLAADPDLEALQEEAAGLIGQRFLEGLPPLRLDLRGASNVFRFNRAERAHLGLGLSYRLGGDAIARAGAGYSFGTEEPSARLGIDFDAAGADFTIEGFWNQPRDLGYPAAAGAMNTLSSLAAAAGAGFGHDFEDLWFARGARAEMHMRERILLSWRLGGHATLEFARAAAWLVDGFEADPADELDRPLAVIDNGRDLRVGVELARRAAAESLFGWEARVGLDWGSFQPDDGTSGSDALQYGDVSLDLSGRRGTSGDDWGLMGRLRAGLLLGDPPLQRHDLLGGRATVPGHAFRTYVGDRSALLQLELRRRISRPWLSARASAAVGMTDLTMARPAAAWPSVREGMPASAGVGLGIVNEILWLDVWRGFGDGGDWEVLLTVDPRLWDIL